MRPKHKTRNGAISASEGRDPEINLEEVMALLEERDIARLRKDFKTADRIQHHLLWTLNLEVDDKERTWRCREKM